ncbi:MAG TPA: metalloregulator ArsR/SmtB family transcription factor [Longimicrobiales bacterium]|nr:metalloregulator ArsR/SmtB family transcription factor [Longimicrobiales bacterium]
MQPLGVLANPTRRRILESVWTCERAAGEIAADFDVTFGAVSQHLAVLRDAGMVRVRRDGRRRHYRADRDALGPLADMLEAMWSDRLERLKTVAEHAQRSTS